jgi:hypothetical protein
MKFSFGSDPEFMLKQGNRFKSAIDVIPGDKFDRKKLGDHQAYYDNVLAECSIKPGRSKEEVIDNFRDCFQRYAKFVAPYKLIIQAAQNYPKQELKHPDALEINCDPETCVYSLAEVKPASMEEDFKASTLRTAGGHVHLGHKMLRTDETAVHFTIRMLDLFLGIPSILIDDDRSNKKRKQFYGLAGRYRIQPHGAEYRSLSNFWLNSPKLVSLVYDICDFVLDFVKNEKYNDFWTIDHKTLNNPLSWDDEDFEPIDCYHCHGYDVKNLQSAIDTLNENKAQEFIPIIQNYLPAKLWETIEQCKSPKNNFYQEWAI